MPSYEINNQILDNVDYILSTVPLKNVKSDKIIKINRMLQKEDVENIENKIFHKETTELLEITTFFNKDNFYIGKNFETKEEL